MNSSMNRLKSGHHGNRGFSVPDMAPFAGIMLILVSYFMYNGRLKLPETGLISDSRLPYNEQVCWITPQGTNPVIGIDQDNRFSFSIEQFEPQSPTAATIQTFIIRKVALQHGITFSTSQLSELHTLRFLSTDVENLPDLLSLPPYKRQELIRANVFPPLSKQQLKECVGATKKYAPTISLRQPFFYLRIDSEVETSQVMTLIDLLQDHNINRFNLMAQMR